MAKITSPNQIRIVEWGKSYLWEVYFPDAPKPFNRWFPATDVVEPVYRLETKTIESFVTTYEIPLKSSCYGMKISFLDDVNCSLESWFKTWVRSTILGGNQFVSALATAVKTVQINRFANDRSAVASTTYSVFPKGNLDFVGHSESGLVKFDVDFSIAYVGPTQYVNAGSFQPNKLPAGIGAVGNAINGVAKQFGQAANSIVPGSGDTISNLGKNFGF
jgi:hypothetical protein